MGITYQSNCEPSQTCLKIQVRCVIGRHSLHNIIEERLLFATYNKVLNINILRVNVLSFLAEMYDAR